MTIKTDIFIEIIHRKESINIFPKVNIPIWIFFEKNYKNFLGNNIYLAKIQNKLKPIKPTPVNHYIESVM
jgi:hypothetical protein